MNRYRLSCVCVALAVLACCAKLTPAGFWATYRPELIVRKYSDQGPWGGVRWVHWAAPAPGMFTSADVVGFATSNGWVCQKPVAYSAEQVRAWQSSRKDFPRHIDGESWVIQCDSRWVRVEPGSGDSSTAFGYIQIDRSGTRLAVYHLWGET